MNNTFLQTEIDKMEESPRRDLGIIALYFKEREPDLKNKGQLQVAIRRHLRTAKELANFDNGQILDAIPKAKKITPEWTLETVLKVLTK